MRERILCTGGAGYIGSILVPELLKIGYSVTVLDRFSEGNPTLANCCQFNGFKVVRGDVRDERLLDKLVLQADIVIPLAAIVGAPACDQDATATVTINRDAVVSLAHRISSSQRLIYPNTNSGYGAVENGFCTEDTPLKPLSLYGRTKADADQLILQNGRGVVLRLATVFGMSPRMRLDLLLNDFVYRALNDSAVIVFEGHFNRNFIHVRDVAKAFVHTIENYKEMNGKAYNVVLASGNLSKIELCEKIKKVIPNFVYLEAQVGEDVDKRNCIVSGQRLEMTGWTADWGLDRGIVELIKGLTMLRNRRFGNV